MNRDQYLQYRGTSEALLKKAPEGIAHEIAFSMSKNRQMASLAGMPGISMFGPETAADEVQKILITVGSRMPHEFTSTAEQLLADAAAQMAKLMSDIERNGEKLTTSDYVMKNQIESVRSFETELENDTSNAAGHFIVDAVEFVIKRGLAGSGSQSAYGLQ